MTDESPQYRNADQDEIVLLLVYAGLELKNWTTYSYSENFLTPTDAFSFTVGADDLTDDVKAALVPGAEVRLMLNGLVQCTGYIDSITKGPSRGQGTEWKIEGRDKLSPAVDAHVDPALHFKADTTLAQLLEQVLGNYGFTKFVVDDVANQKVSTGRKPKASQQGGDGKHKPLKDYKLKALKPNQHEGAFAFAARVAERHDLNIWPSSDGETLIIGQPDFDQEATYTFRRTSDYNNLLDPSTVKVDTSEQPSVIFADGRSGGGEYGKSKVSLCMVNPLVGTQPDGSPVGTVKALLARFPAAVQIYSKFSVPMHLTLPAKYTARAMYVHDEDSHTPEQLKSFLLKKMMDKLRKAVSIHYTAEGHGQMLGGQFVPFAVNTTARVYDEPCEFSGEQLWILSRTMEKSRNGGTTTKLELLLPYTLPYGEPQTTPSTGKAT